MVSVQQRASFASIAPQGNILVLGSPSGGAPEAVQAILRRRGHSVELAPADINAISHIDKYDLLVLELDTHDAGAVRLCARLRTMTFVPVLVVVPETARNQGIQALELGADSFIVAPFDRRELVARSEALVRRYRHMFLPMLHG